MSAALFNGTAVKILKDILKFKDGTTLTSTVAGYLSTLTSNVQDQIDGLSGGVPTFNYTAQTGTYSADIFDYVVASGTSFAITLPTAVGQTGKLIGVQHDGTSLSQIYTINTTSAQTIEHQGVTYNSGEVKAYTVGEIYWFMSTGSGWKIVKHETNTSWISSGTAINFYTFTITSGSATIGTGVYTNNGQTFTCAKTIASQTTLIMRGTGAPEASGTLTRTSGAGTGDATITFSAVTGSPYNVTATTTAPTHYGEPTVNTSRWRREGHEAIYEFTYTYGAFAGVTGSGDYIYGLPSGLSFNTTQYPLFTGGNVQATNSQTPATIASVFPAWGRGAQAAGNHFFFNAMAPYTSTTYRIYGAYSNSEIMAPPGSTYMPAATGSQGFHWVIRFPVDGWLP